MFGLLACPQAALAGSEGLRSVMVAGGFDRPLFVTHAPGDHGRIFVLTKTGRVFVVDLSTGAKSEFLHITPISTNSERGLLGLAFHPDFPETNAFFVNYTDANGNTVIARYGVTENPNVADSVGEVVLTVNQPAPNHNGGWMGFGPDGYLYIALGDGGNQRDPNGMGQNIVGELLGNILRIDINSDQFPENANRNYAIPPDNPFVGIPGEDEIWAFGLRNPWRCAFDSLTGDFYIADVGESELEEVNFQPFDSSGGENYGWRCFEGTTCTVFGLCDCEAVESIAPIHEYSHENSNCSISGGEVYRGCAIPELDGEYFFGDFCSSRIWSLANPIGTPVVTDRTLALQPPPNGIMSVSSFGRDAAGEIYICDYLGGKVWKIVQEQILELVAADPPDDVVDARVHVEQDGTTPVGWDGWSLTFNRSANCLFPESFKLTMDGPSESLPIIASVVVEGEFEAKVVLDRVIYPGSWISFYHNESGSGARMGSLPGDVDASRTVSPLDILALVDHLNEAVPPLALWSTDIDRSGVVDAADVTSLIVLLEGSIDGQVWLGASLP